MGSAHHLPMEYPMVYIFQNVFCVFAKQKLRSHILMTKRPFEKERECHDQAGPG